MNFLEKIQGLPERKRKIILWTVMVVLAASLLAWYIKTIKQKLNDFSGENLKKGLNLPDFEKELDNLPKFESPKTELPEVMPETATGTEDEATTTGQNLFENQ
jgi:hypothetical protein